MFSREEVLKIARLARLELTEEEVARYSKQLGRVLEYVQELNSLKIDDATSVRHIPRDAVSVREDMAKSFPDVRALMANAPKEETNHFLLPTTVERS